MKPPCSISAVVRVNLIAHSENITDFTDITDDVRRIGIALVVPTNCTYRIKT